MTWFRIAGYCALMMGAALVGGGAMSYLISGEMRLQEGAISGVVLAILTVWEIRRSNPENTNG